MKQFLQFFTVEQWVEGFEKIGALWSYKGDPSPDKAHALLTSGKHSNGFFSGSLVVCDPVLCSDACNDLLVNMQHEVSNFDLVESFWGSAMGAITIAHELARQAGTRFGYTEKSGDEMIVKRFSVFEGERIVVAEDVMTTGGTTTKTIAALEKAGADVLPFILVLVNRSGKTHLGDRKIIALIEKDLPIWQPEICPYCTAGSKAVRPKESWEELTA